MKDIKLKDMIPSAPYIVTKGNDTITKGEHIKIDFSGSLISLEAKGWLEEDVYSLPEFDGMRVKVDAVALARIEERWMQAGEYLSRMPEIEDTKA